MIFVTSSPNMLKSVVYMKLYKTKITTTNISDILRQKYFKFSLLIQIENMKVIKHSYQLKIHVVMHVRYTCCKCMSEIHVVNSKAWYIV